MSLGSFVCQALIFQIGVMIMVHGDDKGVRLPPHVAPIQVVIVPGGDNLNMLVAKANELASILRHAGIRVEVDQRNYNFWEIRGQYPPDNLYLSNHNRCSDPF
jgi:threonyl-tRNA synthetase